MKTVSEEMEHKGSVFNDLLGGLVVPSTGKCVALPQTTLVNGPFFVPSIFKAHIVNGVPIRSSTRGRSFVCLDQSDHCKQMPSSA